MNHEGELIAKNISRKRGDTQVLQGVNISVKPGQITALIGPSGGGKTTLLKALSLLEYPDAGEVNIDGVSYNFPLNGNQKAVPPWPQLTVVFQQLFLWPHLTLRENILLPLSKDARSESAEMLEQLFERFHMQAFLDRFPNESSLGQRQRAALVRAMALKPKYILLDEITSSLDVEQVALILTEIRRLRDSGVGILLITHLLHFAREAADAVVFLEAGRVIESGGAEVLSNPREQRVRDFLAITEFAS